MQSWQYFQLEIHVMGNRLYRCKHLPSPKMHAACQITGVSNPEKSGVISEINASAPPIVSYLLSVFNLLRTTTFICSSTNLLWRASNTFWTSHSIYWTQCNAFCLAAQKKIPMWLFLTGLFLQLPNCLTILKTLWSVHSVSSAKKSYPNNVLPMDQMVAFFISVVMSTFTTSPFPFPMWSVIHWSTTA